jgi:cobalt-zinc-cadmium efflux system outer membrane protein
MKQRIYILVFLILGLCAACPAFVCATGRWQYPIDTTGREATLDDSVVTLNEALDFVRRYNPILRSLSYQEESARFQLDQAGRWSNPELGVEMEEVGWDAPGLKESELTVTLSQELELFGQRSARKRLARAELDVAKLHTTLSTFDLYLETKLRYFTLAHAQEEYCLTETAVTLAEHIVENTELRISEGAALQSGLLLARMELQRTKLLRAEATQRLLTARIMLASLWNDPVPESLAVAMPQPDFNSLLNQLPSANLLIDSTRDMLALAERARILDCEKRLARTEAKPGVTLTGGFRRMEIDGSKSFLFGVSVPLPFFNRNQGTMESLEAQLQSLQYETENLKIVRMTEIQSGVAHLRRLIESYATLDSELLPTAEEAFQTLERTYESGRLPYTSILEAGRSLIELRFEHNNIMLSIYEQIISLEKLTGLKLNTELR